jgi:glycosyltransferase involved in cell wall biosynthesis
VSATPHSLLILVPAYNEEQRIEPVLREYAGFFQREYSGKFQIVVVLNGCRDNTLGVVQRVAKDFPSVSALEFKEPIGKGGALIEGLRLAPLADLIGYVDADGASPPQALLKLLQRIEEADCVVGSRWLPGAVLHQAQPWVRQITSRTFHLIVEILFWMNIKDTQCPCKLMRRDCVEKIHSSLLIADLAFDVNLLVSLTRAGFRVLEVPIEWTDKIGSKVSSSLVRQSLTMLLSVVRLRLIYWPKLYRGLRLLRPLEGWVYKTLYTPPSASEDVQVQKPSPKN